MDAPDLVSAERVIGGRTFDFARHVAVMAIVNRTPDSFHDRGRTYALGPAVAAVRAAAEAGADWIDIGGVPFAPGPEVSGTRSLAVAAVRPYRVPPLNRYMQANPHA